MGFNSGFKGLKSFGYFIWIHVSFFIMGTFFFYSPSILQEHIMA